MSDHDFKVIDLLVVDDDELVLERYRRYFSRNTTYRCHLTTQASDARRIIGKFGVRFVVVDFRMPEMLGTELLAELVTVDLLMQTRFILSSASFLSPGETACAEKLPVDIIDKESMLTRQGLADLATRLAESAGNDSINVAC